MQAQCGEVLEGVRERGIAGTQAAGRLSEVATGRARRELARLAQGGRQPDPETDPGAPEPGVRSAGGNDRLMAPDQPTEPEL